MSKHPGHFWICAWIFLATLFICGELTDIRKAIEANTAALIARSIK